ncbi:MAG: hypothetical protein LBG52_02850 [Candidatus Peribacteria bacterium]|nr:hypothetical protein [Candidatus Peribacteria bacterium]
MSYAQAHIGDIKGNIPNRAGYNMDNYDLSTMHIIGRLSGTTGTIVKVNTRSDV